MSRNYGKLARQITSRERQLFAGKEGRDLDAMFRHYVQGDVSPRMLSEALSVFDAFQSVSPIEIVAAELNNLKTEGEKVTGDDVLIGSHRIRAFPDPKSSKNDFHFEVSNFEMRRNLFSMHSRVLPIRWRIDHVEERLVQRRDSAVNFSDGKMIFPILISLAMCVAMERKHNWRKVKEVPFVVPYDDGLYLGSVEKRDKRDHYNRLLGVGSDDPERMKLVPLEWMPEISMNIYTFIGSKEMSFQQNRIREILSQYRDDGDSFWALVAGMHAYSESGHPEGILDEKACLNYQRIVEELNQFMDSKLWRGHVVPPNTRKMAGGLVRRL